MAAIRSELHCSDVNLYGTDLRRLEEGGRVALREGLRISIQPRSIEQDREQALGIVEAGARVAERLRSDGEVTLNTGCEMSLFTGGFLPGRTFMSRIRSLTWAWPFLPAVSFRLNRHLVDVAAAARRHFGARSPMAPERGSRSTGPRSTWLASTSTATFGTRRATSATFAGCSNGTSPC
jgi:hypothetical protein